MGKERRQRLKGSIPRRVRNLNMDHQRCAKCGLLEHRDGFRIQLVGFIFKYFIDCLHCRGEEDILTQIVGIKKRRRRRVF